MGKGWCWYLVELRFKRSLLFVLLQHQYRWRRRDLWKRLVEHLEPRERWVMAVFLLSELSPDTIPLLTTGLLSPGPMEIIIPLLSYFMFCVLGFPLFSSCSCCSIVTRNRFFIFICRTRLTFLIYTICIWSQRLHGYKIFDSILHTSIPPHFGPYCGT